jgi:methenyltetrahydromethanopterin cyclohydrolase
LKLPWQEPTTPYSTEQSTYHDYDDEAALQKIVEQAPSMASKDYGKPFLQIFREADKDFYKIDHGLFAPAVLMINNARTGRTFKAGQINPKVLSQALGF